ncbi:MAG: hypothetical protein HQL08_05060 [Nitrospirae bacterium]|nr:hypothetical protein [Nitrospirota bacterium]
MKRLLERFETSMMAAAFAEEGEFETARQILKESGPRKTSRPDLSTRQKPQNRTELRAE